jgi:hypothetical protein
MIECTYWPAVDRPGDARRFQTTTERLVERFRTPIVTEDKLSLAGWAPATFSPNYRKLENHEASYGVGFDLDGDGTDLDENAEALGDYCGFIYTSYRHTRERQRGRAILWTSRPIVRREHPRVWRYGARLLPNVGQEAKDASRLWFVPGIPPGGTYRLIELRGALLDVDEALACVGDVDEAIENAPPVVPVEATSDVIERARRYLQYCDVAVSGHGGSRQTFVVAMKLTRGFQLDEETAYRLMTEWNTRCKPPWSEAGLRRKIAHAASRGGMLPGKLLDAERAA